jgi:hypothetical protein
MSFKNKRGSETLQIVVVSVIIILLIIFVFILPIKQITEDKTFNKKKIAVDLAYLFNAIQSSPENLDLTYKKQDLYITIKQPCEISISDKKEEQIKLNKKECISINNIKIPEKESLSTASLEIKKQDNTITIEE